jgi:acetoin utilization deacetylase AcuC-like enzyme
VVPKQGSPLLHHPSHRKSDSSSSDCGLLETISFCGKRPRQCLIISPDATPFSSLVEEDLTSCKPSTCGVALVFEAAPGHVHPRLHKERPSRIACIRQALQTSGVLDLCTVLLEDDDCQKTTTQTKAKAQQDRILEIIQTVHSKGYIKRLQTLHKCPCLQDEADQYDSVYLTPHSWDSAVRAVSSLCLLLDQVLFSKEIKYGFACIRPPGHHASMSLANGYCLVNNVAVAAQYALDQFPQDTRKRIAIIDWDVHHGNGTQAIFWNNPQVLYSSIHVQRTFPYAAGSTSKNVGGPHAKGKTVNLPWSSSGMGDEEYLAAMQTLILPIIQEFQPTLLLISAGFDAAVGDVGSCNVTPQGFGHMARQVLRTAKAINCPVVASLEGGYRHSILGECVTSVVQTMASASKQEQEEQEEPIPDISLDDICPIAAKNIQATRQAQQPYWNCFSNGES